MIIGVLLAVADTEKHVPELFVAGPYRSGLDSEAFATGLILSELVTALVSYRAWRDKGGTAS